MQRLRLIAMPHPFRYSLLLRKALILVALGCYTMPPAQAQEPTDSDPPPDAEVSSTPEKVEVAPVADDQSIATRLSRILNATGWFDEPTVSVDEGVVFLEGRAEEVVHKEWAGKLAANTQDVVAVVNRMEVVEKSMWDFSSSWFELRQLGKEAIRNIPLMIVALLGLVLTWLFTKWTARGAAYMMTGRMKSPLLSDVVARAAVPVFLLGVYLILRFSGLTRLAMTVLGGTGLIALVVGFAFRDIAENFLASILISIQNPFARGDLIEVSGFKGYVQSVNTRAALLMTLEGNHVQIPNATLYKEPIINYTANPNARFDFVVGIGYGDSISQAQEAALRVLKEHPAVVNDPEPLVLVESLGAATINLRIYFWIDIARYSALKVRSAVIRLTKRAFDQEGITMPDEAREIVFPSGVPVKMVTEAEAEQASPRPTASKANEDSSLAQASEGDLASEAGDIEQQARKSRTLEGGQNLLEPD